MGFEHQSVFGLWISGLTDSVTNAARGVLGLQKLTPEQSLQNIVSIDPRLIPKVPMNNTDIDANLLLQLSKMGMKRGKLVTEESHPELMASWQVMSCRAGLKRTPQLIIVESDVINAMTVSPEEVIMTTGLMKKLDLREVCAVLGHELGHANSDHKTPRIAAMALFSGLGAMIAHHLFGKKTIDSAEASALEQAAHELLAVSVGASAGAVAANQISVKPTEFQADLKGAAISGDPEGLISALRKLENNRKHPPLLRFISWLQSGYPTTEQRIANLQKIADQMPIYARPEPLTVVPPAATPQPGHKISQVAATDRVEAQERSAAPALN